MIQQMTAQLFFALGAAGFIAAIATACAPGGASDKATTPPAGVPSEGRLGARPLRDTRPAGQAEPGIHPLGISTGRDGLLYVPAGYRDDTPAPLVLLLHGAGGDAQGGISLLKAQADAANLILLAPASRRQTWDIIVREFGPDVSYIDQALAQTFSRYAVDPAHIGIGGFSDGASYALSLGLTNGDLFTHILSFSPGFMRPGRQEGKPRIFNSHGTRDSVLPIDVCSRKIVPQLQRAGYDVTYKEFDGPHTVPPEIASESVTWFIGAKP